LLMPKICQAEGPRPFEFGRDTFAFENETYWEYHFDEAGKTTFRPRAQKPAYGHRCFVLTRAARQFFYQARFDAAQPAADEADLRRRVRGVVARDPRRPGSPDQQIVIPGFANLREFSAAHGKLLKAECGGAWRSYVLRSHWRMVFPISRAHQAATAASLTEALRRNVPSIVHLVRFPALTINHSMLVFAAAENGTGIDFQAYDPNNVAGPTTLSFRSESNTFHLPRNHYWAGGDLDIIEIYRSWLM
jgi:hypothetical protein